MIREILTTAGLLALALFLLTGCGGHTTQFTCPGTPSKPLCLSTSEIYRLTDGSPVPPAGTPRQSLIESDSPLGAGNGWRWTQRYWN